MHEVTCRHLDDKSLIGLYCWVAGSSTHPHDLWKNPGPETEVQLGIALVREMLNPLVLHNVPWATWEGNSGGTH